MTNFKKYLGYGLKRSLMRTVIFSLIAIAVTYIYVYANAVPFVIIGNPEYNGNTGIAVLMWTMIVLAAGIPVLETASFKNKRNLDTYYSLPLSRFHLALAHYISGFVQILVIYTASFITAVLVLLRYAEHFNLLCLPAYYVFSILFGLGLYSFYMFIFGEANTVLDGAIFCAMWTLGGMLLLGYVTDIISNICREQMTATWYNDLVETPALFGTSYAPLMNITELFLHKIEPKADVNSTYFIICRHMYSFIVWACIYAACAYGYFRTFTRKGAEKAGEISSSMLGYRSLIPIYGFLMVNQGGFNIITVLWLVMMFIGYVIYRRGMRLAKSDIVILIIYAVAFFLLVGIMDVPAEGILLLAGMVFFIVSLCLFLGARKENREKPGFHGEKEMMRLGTMLVVSATLFLIGIIASMWPIIVFLFSLSIVA